jgi:hypothetical protein
VVAVVEDIMVEFLVEEEMDNLVVLEVVEDNQLGLVETALQDKGTMEELVVHIKHLVQEEVVAVGPELSVVMDQPPHLAMEV